MDFTAIYSSVGTGIVAVIGVIAHNRSYFKKAFDGAVKELKSVVSVAHTVAIDAESAIKSPLTKAVETEFSHKLTADLRKSEIGRLAATALHGAQKALDALSQTEKDAIAMYITKQAPKEWNVTEKEVLDAITEAQKDADTLAAWDVFKFASAYSGAVNATKAAPVEQTPA